jgi:hypothetical protein
MFVKKEMKEENQPNTITPGFTRKHAKTLLEVMTSIERHWISLGKSI